MNSASLADMNARITTQASRAKKSNATARQSQGSGDSVGELSRFRPNLLVGGAGMAAYAEDDWQRVCIGKHDFFTAGGTLRDQRILA